MRAILRIHRSTLLAPRPGEADYRRYQQYSFAIFEGEDLHFQLFDASRQAFAALAAGLLLKAPLRQRVTRSAFSASKTARDANESTHNNGFSLRWNDFTLITMILRRHDDITTLVIHCQQKSRYAISEDFT